MRLLQVYSSMLVHVFHLQAVWESSSGITVKIPKLFDGPTSWFKYEELIDDWLLTTGMWLLHGTRHPMN